jgi:hypothetical protein
MRDIVELRDDIMPVFWADIAEGLVDLRAKVAQDHDGRLVGAEEDGAHEELEVLERILVVVDVKLEDDHVRLVWDVVCVAVAKVVRVHAAHRAVRDLGRRVREHVVPPLQEAGGVAAGR